MLIKRIILSTLLSIGISYAIYIYHTTLVMGLNPWLAAFFYVPFILLAVVNLIVIAGTKPTRWALMLGAFLVLAIAGSLYYVNHQGMPELEGQPRRYIDTTSQ